STKRNVPKPVPRSGNSGTKESTRFHTGPRSWEDIFASHSVVMRRATAPPLSQVVTATPMHRSTKSGTAREVAHMVFDRSAKHATMATADAIKPPRDIEQHSATPITTRPTPIQTEAGSCSTLDSDSIHVECLSSVDCAQCVLRRRPIPRPNERFIE